MSLDRFVSLFVSRDLTRRDLALDALRGLMILGMVMVNHPPPAPELLAPFVHAPWHGWTLADVVFPGFLFAVGVAIRFAMVDGRDEPLPPSRSLYGRLARRFAVLMVLNFALVNFPYYEFGKLQFSGTLALIAWCYVIAALLHIHTGWRAQLALALLALSLEWALYSFLPVPGVGRGLMTPEGNAGQFIDQIFLEPVFGAGHGEGKGPQLLPFLGAAATTILGLLAGHWQRSDQGVGVRMRGLFLVGLCALAAGSVLQWSMPLNKALWTPTYALFMSGIALVIYSILCWFSHRGWRTWLVPLQVAGVNALFFYVFAQSLQRVLVFARVPGSEGTTTRLRYFIYEHYVVPWLPGKVGVLVFTLIFLAICYAVSLALYRGRIFFKL